MRIVTTGKENRCWTDRFELMGRNSVTPPPRERRAMSLLQVPAGALRYDAGLADTEILPTLDPYKVIVQS